MREFYSYLIKLARDRQGNVALIFALTGMIIVLASLTVLELLNQQRVNSRLQDILDSAVIAATKHYNASMQERTAAFDKVLSRNNSLPANAKIVEGTLKDEGGIMVGVLKATRKPIFSLVLGDELVAIRTSRAVGGNDRLEIILSLDVTGSMRNSMPALKTAANALIDVVKKEAVGEVYIGLVPYAGAVNVGKPEQNGVLMDTSGRSKYHGTGLEGHWLFTKWLPSGAYKGGCVIPWSPPPTGKSKDTDIAALGGKIITNSSQFIFGGPALAASQQTADTSSPLTGTYSDFGTFKPAGFNYGLYCDARPGAAPPYEYFANPGFINIFDLYSRLPNIAWGGCVSARAEPYDVDDTPPINGKYDTLWVPFFWPSDDKQNKWVDNNYNKPATWSSVGNTSILKYNMQGKYDIDETAPDTKGPNKGCPSPIIPLTEDIESVKSDINKLSHWDSGGTVIAEGVAWGWRALSNRAPFVQGAAPRKNLRKILVLMSDGVNEFVSASNTHGSGTNAYGGLRWGRLPNTVWTFGLASSYLDQRTQLACDNAKKDGIEIYTILFRETSETSVALLKYCSSSSKHFYQAKNDSELLMAFKSIARSTSPIRLVS